MKHIVAAVSDLHCGSSLGLCHDGPVHLDDGGSYHPSKVQLWLNDKWHDYWDRVADARESGSVESFSIILNGDLLEGDHHETPQIISRLAGIEMDVLFKCLERPLSLRPDNIFIVRGTESHVGKSADKEEGVAKALASQQYPVVKEPDLGTHTWWALRAEIGGVLIDAAHHGRIGRRAHTRKSYHAMYAFDIWAERALADERPPDIALRSHNHKYANSHDAYPTQAIALPAWQVRTAYVYRIAAESVADIGGLIITAEDGEYEAEPVLYKPSRGTTWKSQSHS